MKFCFFLSSLNPLSLMNTSRLYRNFIFLFSLLELGSFAWGERYETVFVYSEDTEPIAHTEVRAFLESNSFISTQVLSIPQGEAAYVFSVAAGEKPDGTLVYTGAKSGAYVPYIIIDTDGLDGNTTLGGWTYSSVNWNTTNTQNQPFNISTTSPIVGPATVRIVIKPSSSRQNTYTATSYWARSDYGNWDFKASEGFVTFRIVGSEQAPSKKFATVIPENASGNVRIVLEQSTDLINWSSANPGVFPPSTSKRFFRVRSVEE
jgi:hypothetical protein